MAFIQQLASPLGTLTVHANDHGITAVLFDQPSNIKPLPSAITQHCCAELQGYFCGTLFSFTVPVAPQGTLFQQRVWQQLQAIPYGQTKHYGSIASSLGNPSASRAVGMANGKNPISIIIPCHRVIGKNGKLTGYAWGLERKQALLSLEKITYR